jgi:hypothetical protein
MTDLDWRQSDEKREALINEFVALNGSHGSSRNARIALAWHDVVCPEAGECRDRPLHAASHPLAYGGLLARFLDNARELGVSL